MPWRDSRTIPFTRIDILSAVPPASGVYAVFDGEACLLVGDSWNLRARLLELANIADAMDELSITFECCSEEEASGLRRALETELVRYGRDGARRKTPGLPGIRVWTDPDQGDV